MDAPEASGGLETFEWEPPPRGGCAGQEMPFSSSAADQVLVAEAEMLNFKLHLAFCIPVYDAWHICRSSMQIGCK